VTWIFVHRSSTRLAMFDKRRELFSKQKEKDAVNGSQSSFMNLDSGGEKSNVQCNSLPDSMCEIVIVIVLVSCRMTGSTLSLRSDISLEEAK
jgi:hypothetical protein